MRLFPPRMIRVIEQAFGRALNPKTKTCEDIKRFTMCNDNDMSVAVITLGASINGIKVPDAKGNVQDVVLGFDKPAAYLNKSDVYMGSTIGRDASFISRGRFRLLGEKYKLSRNYHNKHHLHGGNLGFSKLPWQVQSVHPDGIELTICSEDSAEGYPGQVTATIRYMLTEANVLNIRMEAVTTKPTPINLANHTYFNLAGHDAGKEALQKHTVMIHSTKLIDVDDDHVPTGSISDVEGTDHDLRNLGNLGERMMKLPHGGYHANYCIRTCKEGLERQAHVVHCQSGRWMSVYSNQPSVEFSTANELPDIKKGECPLLGKDGAEYERHGALCLQTQQYPDAPNIPEFPSIILQPKQKYCHDLAFKFGLLRHEKPKKY